MKEKSLAPYMHPQIKVLEDELHNKQVQLNFLMRITQAINANMSQRDLLKCMLSFYILIWA